MGLVNRQVSAALGSAPSCTVNLVNGRTEEECNRATEGSYRASAYGEDRGRPPFPFCQSNHRRTAYFESAIKHFACLASVIARYANCFAPHALFSFAWPR